MAKPKTAGELRRLKDDAHLKWGGIPQHHTTEYKRAQKRFYDLLGKYHQAYTEEKARRIAYLSDPDRAARMQARGHDVAAMIAKIESETP